MAQFQDDPAPAPAEQDAPDTSTPSQDGTDEGDAADDFGLGSFSSSGENKTPGRHGSMSEEKTATLRALDKITGRSTDFEIEVGEPVVYGSLKIDLEVCFQSPPEEPPESAAFLQIETAEAVRMQSMTVPRLASDVEGVEGSGVDAKALASRDEEEKEADEKDEELLFSGWMFASSPGLNALEHPVYDVWVIRCTERTPVKESTPAEPAE